MDKFEHYVIEASKQCGRNTLMQIEEPVHWASYCQRSASGELHSLAHPLATVPGPTLGASSVVRGAVGPEGGFTDEEISLALGHGWQAVGLGPRILRIETAALVLAIKTISR